MPWRIASFAEACWKSMKQIDSLRNGKEWGCSFTRGCWFNFAWRGHCSICFFSEFVNLIRDSLNHTYLCSTSTSIAFYNLGRIFSHEWCVYIHEITCSHDVMTYDVCDIPRSLSINPWTTCRRRVFMQQMCFKTTFLRWFMIPSWRFPSLRCHPWFLVTKTTFKKRRNLTRKKLQLMYCSCPKISKPKMRVTLRETQGWESPKRKCWQSCFDLPNFIRQVRRGLEPVWCELGTNFENWGDSRQTDMIQVAESEHVTTMCSDNFLCSVEARFEDFCHCKFDRLRSKMVGFSPTITSFLKRSWKEARSEKGLQRGW